MAKREPVMPPIGGKVIHVGNGSAVWVFNTLADLKAKKVASVKQDDQAIIIGYDTEGDGRSMQFRYDASSSQTADDINYVDPDEGDGQWVRTWVNLPSIESGDAGKLLRVKGNESGHELFNADTVYPNDNYISYDPGVEPHDTDAALGTIGAYIRADGSLQKLKHNGTSWDKIGSRLVTNAFLKSNLVVLATTFGAKGDGVTDNRDALNSAMQFVSGKGGGTVYLPAMPSPYSVEGSISIPSNVSLVGAGYASHIRMSDSITTVTNILRINKKENVFLHNFRISNSTRENIEVIDSQNVIAHTLWTEESGREDDSGDGLDYDACTDCVSFNVRGKDCQGGAVHISQGCKRVVSINCFAENCRQGSLNLPAIDIYGGEDCQLIGCISVNSQRHGLGVHNKSTRSSIIGGKAVGSVGIGMYCDINDGYKGNFASDVSVYDTQGTAGIRTGNCDLHNCHAYDSKGNYGIQVIAQAHLFNPVADGVTDQRQAIVIQCDNAFIRIVNPTLKNIVGGSGLYCSGSGNIVRVDNYHIENIPTDFGGFGNDTLIVNGWSEGAFGGDNEPPAENYQVGDIVKNTSDGAMFILRHNGSTWNEFSLA